MLLIYSLFAVLFLQETSGQLFSRFGFEFPGFSDPEAFGDDAFTSIQQRISDLMKGKAKHRKGVKTKIKTEQRGDENVTTIEEKGKGFDSWARLTTFGNLKQGGGKSMSKMISGLFGGEKGNRKSECSGQKPCPVDKYCDPVKGVCKEKISEGERCFMKDQCITGTICLWGRCSPGKKGQSGTFCNKDKDCAAENYCTEDPQISIFQPICKPKLDEGASCGRSNPFGLMRIMIGKRDTSEDAKLTNPCKTGLKCEQVGMFGGMVCVPDSLKVNKEAEKVKLEGKKKPGMNEGADDEEEEGNDDEEEQSGATEGVEERPDTEEGGDIVPSKQENDTEKKPTNIMNAKPQNQGNQGNNNNNAQNGVSQSGQQKPPSNGKPVPVPALKPPGVPNEGNRERKKKHKKKKHRKEGRD